MKTYPYLVAGLPDLVFQGGGALTPLEEIRDWLRQQLHPDDYGWVEWLYFPADHQNLLARLHRDTAFWNPAGNWTSDQLDEFLADGVFPKSYQNHFYQAFREETPFDADLSWENQLWQAFLQEAEQLDQPFLAAWFRRERTMRNLLAALNCRRFQVPVEREIIGSGEEAEAFRTSRARDFGLAPTWPLVDKIIQVFENPNLEERERYLSQLAWSWVDETNTFAYFTIENILGFLIQLDLASRWRRLDPEQGAALFLDLQNRLKNAHTFV